MTTNAANLLKINDITAGRGVYAKWSTVERLLAIRAIRLAK